MRAMVCSVVGRRYATLQIGLIDVKGLGTKKTWRRHVFGLPNNMTQGGLEAQDDVASFYRAGTVVPSDDVKAMVMTGQSRTSWTTKLRTD